MSAYDVSQTLRKDVATGKVTLAGTTKAVLDDSRIGPHGGQLAVNGAHNPATLDLDFANGRYHLDDGGPAEITDPASILSVTRASTKMVMGPNGKLREVPIDTLAREFDPLTGEPRGVLIEESRTNQILWSESFDDVAWTKARTSITTDAVMAPDGNTTADKLVEDTTASATHQVKQNYGGFTSGVQYTLVTFIKKSERTVIRLALPDEAFPGNIRECDFDAANGTASPVGLLEDYSITDVGGGWFRCALTSTADVTTNGPVFLYINNGSVVYTGDGTSGIYIWGAQLEEGSTPSSYIPTTDAAVTRAEDSVSRTLGEEHRNDEWTVQIEFACKVYDFAGAQYLFTYNSGSAANSEGVRLTSGGAISMTIRSSGSTAGNISSTIVEGRNKLAVSKRQGDYTFVLNGIRMGDLLDLPTSSPTRFDIGSLSGGSVANVDAQKAKFHPYALTEAELVKLTS